jgi:hypothetical protein
MKEERIGGWRNYVTMRFINAKRLRGEYSNLKGNDTTFSSENFKRRVMSET